MKLNFWQWLGVVLLGIGAVLYFKRNANTNATIDSKPAATQPAK